MNREENEILEIVKEFSEQEIISLMENIKETEVPLSDVQKKRIKQNVIGHLRHSMQGRMRNRRIALALCIAFIITFLVAVPFGQDILAEISKKLYFIPGIGKVVETEGIDVYVLPEQVVYEQNGRETIVKSVMKEGNRITIRMEGDGIGGSGKLTLRDEAGVEYTSGHSIWGQGARWLTQHTFYDIPEQISRFSILLSKDIEIPIALKRVESYQDYASMGPTDIQNGLGITLVPDRVEDRIRFDLIDHLSPTRKVAFYGNDDKDGHYRVHILVKDENEGVYPLQYAEQYYGTLSEFYFEPEQGVKEYVVVIPEVMLEYKVDHEVVIPVPKEGETEINRRIKTNGFVFDIVKSVREGEKLRVYVDTHYDREKPENLRKFHLHAGTLGGYSWHYTDDLTVEYYEFMIVNPDQRVITVKLEQMYTVLEGPWELPFKMVEE